MPPPVKTEEKTVRKTKKQQKRDLKTIEKLKKDDQKFREVRN